MENSADNAAYVLFRQTGFNVVSELQSIAGRTDLVVTTKESVFIFELKMDKGMEAEAAAEEALNQIEEKGYATRFIVSGKTTRKIGVVFSSEGKGLVGWKEKEN